MNYRTWLFSMSEYEDSPTFLFDLWDTLCEEKLVASDSNKNISDDLLLALHSIHGSVLERAVELIDKGSLTVYRTKENSRELLQIVGSGENIYTLFHNLNYCQCQAYTHQVLKNKTNVTCKHVLAATLSYFMSKYKVIELSSEDFAKLLISSFIVPDSLETI